MDIGAGTTDGAIRAALNGLAARQRVAADNIANVDTPGFAAARVEFEAQLKAALGKADGNGRSPIDELLGGRPADPSRVEPQVVTTRGTRRGDGNNVDVDQEMVQLAATNITYNALAQLTASRFQMLRNVVSDGRR